MENMLKVWAVFGILALGYGVSFLLVKITKSHDAFSVCMVLTVIAVICFFAFTSGSVSESSSMSYEEAKQAGEKERKRYTEIAKTMNDQDLLALEIQLEKALETPGRESAVVRKARLDAVTAEQEKRRADRLGEDR